MILSAWVLAAGLGGAALAQDTPLAPVATSPTIEAVQTSPDQVPDDLDRLDEAAYDEGWTAGRVEALGQSTRKPLLMGMGSGFLIGGGGMTMAGVVGLPCVAIGCTAPAIGYAMRPPEPPPGEWTDQPRPYQVGYTSGYQSTTKRIQGNAAISGGILGAGIGAVTALIVVAAVGEATGQTNLF